MKYLKYWYIIMAVLLLSVSTLAGCEQDKAAPVTSTPVVYTDDLGRTVEIEGTPQRIISLSPSNTEMVFALGLGEGLIGVTTFCNYPAAAADIEKVSEFSEVDIERIAHLNPDLILADDFHKSEVVPALERLGIPVLIIRPATIDDILDNIRLLGEITGRATQAQALITSLQQRVEAITAKSAKLSGAKPGILYVTWHDPIWTAGDNTMIGDLVHKVGGTNIVAEIDGHSTVTLETVIQRNPQIIIVMGGHGEQNTSLEYIKAEPRLQVTDALQNDRVYLIDADIFGRFTPRIVDGLEELAKLTHPEIFNQE